MKVKFYYYFHFLRLLFFKTHWLAHMIRKRKAVLESSYIIGKTFFHFKILAYDYFVCSQFEVANTNEIKRNIHLVNILFKLISYNHLRLLMHYAIYQINYKTCKYSSKNSLKFFERALDAYFNEIDALLENVPKRAYFSYCRYRRQ